MATLSVISDATSKFGLPLVGLLSLSAWIQGFRSFVWFAVILHLKEDLRLDSVASQVLISSVFLPINLKPIYGMVSDGLHLAGISRMKHLLVCSALVAASWALLFFFPFISESTLGLTVVLLAGNIASSCADVIVDAILVQASKSEGPKSAGNLQSLAWLSVASGGVIGALVSGPAHETLKPHGMFGVFSALPIAQVGLCTLLDNHSQEHGAAKVNEQHTMPRGLQASVPPNEVEEQSKPPGKHLLFGEELRKGKEAGDHKRRRLGGVEKETRDKDGSREQADRSSLCLKVAWEPKKRRKEEIEHQVGDEKDSYIKEAERSCLPDALSSEGLGRDKQETLDECGRLENSDRASALQKRDFEEALPVQLPNEHLHGSYSVGKSRGIPEGSEKEPARMSTVHSGSESTGCEDSYRGEQSLEETRGNYPATQMSGVRSSHENQLEYGGQCQEGEGPDNMVGVHIQGERKGYHILCGARSKEGLEDRSGDSSNEERLAAGGKSEAVLAGQLNTQSDSKGIQTKEGGGVLRGHLDAGEENLAEIDDWEVIEKNIVFDLETSQSVRVLPLPAPTTPLLNTGCPVVERSREVGETGDDDAGGKDRLETPDVAVEASAAFDGNDNLITDPVAKDVHADHDDASAERSSGRDLVVAFRPEADMDAVAVAETISCQTELKLSGHDVAEVVREIDPASVQRTSLELECKEEMNESVETELDLMRNSGPEGCKEEINEAVETELDEHSIMTSSVTEGSGDEIDRSTIEATRDVQPFLKNGVMKQEVLESGAEQDGEDRERWDTLHPEVEIVNAGRGEEEEEGVSMSRGMDRVVDSVGGRSTGLEGDKAGSLESSLKDEVLVPLSSAVDEGEIMRREPQSAFRAGSEEERMRENEEKSLVTGIRQRVKTREVSIVPEDLASSGRALHGEEIATVSQYSEKKGRRNIQAELLTKLFLLWKTLKNPAIHRTLLWYFLADALVPVVGNCVMYFQLDVLQMGASFLGYSRVFGWVGLIFATVAFNRYLKGGRIRPFVCRVQVAMAVFTLTDVIVITRVNRILSIPDGAFILGANSVGIPIGQLKLMPFFVYSARVCPPGLEGSLFAVYTSICTIGGTIGTYLGAALAARLNISSASYGNLALGVTIQSACNFLPLLFFFLIPSDICAVSSQAPASSCHEDGKEKKKSSVQLKED